MAFDLGLLSQPTDNDMNAARTDSFRARRSAWLDMYPFVDRMLMINLEFRETQPTMKGRLDVETTIYGKRLWVRSDLIQRARPPPNSIPMIHAGKARHSLFN